MRPGLIASQKGTNANVLVNSASGTKRLSGSSLWEEGLLLAWSHDGEGTPETPSRWWQKLEKGLVHLGASGSGNLRQNMFHVTLQPLPKIARASYSLNDPPL